MLRALMMYAFRRAYGLPHKMATFHSKKGLFNTVAFERAKAQRHFILGKQCKFLLEHFKGTKAMTSRGHGGNRLCASVKYQACDFKIGPVDLRPTKSGSFEFLKKIQITAFLF